jgi:hypothetical protein
MDQILQEEWRPVVGWEGFYAVSTFGRVLSLDRVITKRNGDTRRVRSRMLVLHLNKNGYLTVCLKRPDKQSVVSVHALVLQSFVGPCPTGLEACHGKGGKHDNSLANLRWDTKQANESDKIADGAVLQGGDHPRARLTEDKVRQIRKMREDGFQFNEIAAVFDITPAHAHRIFHRVSWGHIG